MLKALRNRWLQIAVTMIASIVITPGFISAQNSGVGGDGTMRLMWTGTDSHISLWKLDASNNINFSSSREYGPYYGWTPIALTTAYNGNSYVLWRNTNGSISLWLVDANLNYVTSRAYGPYDGWIAESVSVETAGPGNNRFRVIWRDTAGKVSIWIVDAALNFVNNHVYGPYFGFVPKGNAVTTGELGATDSATAAMAVPAARGKSILGQ
jgi:hypothetical protein